MWGKAHPKERYFINPMAVAASVGAGHKRRGPRPDLLYNDAVAGSEGSTSLNALEDVYRGVLDNERQRVLGLLNVVRVAGSGIWFLLALFFGIAAGKAQWRAPLPFITAYFVIALALLL